MRLQGPNGNVAAVDSTGRLATLATALTSDEVLLINGRAFNVYGAPVVPAANTFFYLQNEGTLNIALGNVSFMSTAASTIFVYWVSGTPTYTAPATTEVNNLRLNSPLTPQAEIQFDTNITGLTPQGILAFERCAVANQRYYLDIPSGISIPQGQAVAFATSAAATITTSAGIGIITL